MLWRNGSCRSGRKEAKFFGTGTGFDCGTWDMDSRYVIHEPRLHAKQTPTILHDSKKLDLKFTVDALVWNSTCITDLYREKSSVDDWLDFRTMNFDWMFRKWFDQSSCACREETWRPIFVRGHSLHAMVFFHTGSKTRSVSGAIPTWVQLKYVKLSRFAFINTRL